MGCCGSDDSAPERNIQNINIPEQWIPIPLFPLKRATSNKVSLNNNQFITAPENNEKLKSNGIYSYNIDSNKWSLFIKYPKKFVVTDEAYLCLNDSLTEICLFSGKCISFINIDSHKFRTYDIAGFYARIFCIDDKFHFVGITDHETTMHCIWNEETKKLAMKHLIVTHDENILNLIHSKVEKKCLLISGLNGPTERKETYSIALIYDIVEDDWSMDQFFITPTNDGHGDEETCLPDLYDGFGSVITNNGKYIILFGGKSINSEGTQSDIDTIRVIEISKMKMMQCTISCPFKGPCSAVLMGNDDILLCSGYVRRHHSDNIDIIIAIDIIKWINSFYSDQTDWIYLFSPYTKTTQVGNWKISLNDILKNQIPHKNMSLSTIRALIHMS